MRVIVDTSVWSLGLRRARKNLSPPQRSLVMRLQETIVRGEVVLLGVVRQEILSGIADRNAFDAVQRHLHEFADLPPDIEDYERAAAFSNLCASRGVAPSTVDMLICSVAVGRDLLILSTDADFDRYARCLPIELLK